MTRASDISDSAARWLIRLEAQTSPEVWDAFQAWLDADPRHRAAFIRLRMSWNRLGLLKNLRPDDGTIDADLLAKDNISPAAAAMRGLQPLKGTPRHPQARIRMSGRWSLYAAAAAVAIVGFIVWLGAGSGGWSSYRTGVGVHEEIALTDGSTVDLNTNTELSTRISGRRRDIKLTRGEALFRVVHDARRPFFVMAGTTVVRAVGTQFSVRIRDAGGVEILVSEGRVAVSAPGTMNGLDTPALLAAAPKVSAGEAASVQRNSVSIRALAARDVSRKLAWTAGHLAFQGETLEEAVQEFNRYNQRQLVIADPAINPVRVGGTFRVNDPDSFAAALQRSFGIRAVPAGGNIRLVRDTSPE